MKHAHLSPFLLGALVTAPVTGQAYLRSIPDLPVLHSPMDVAVDASGNLWIACWQISQIVKLSPTGQELARIGPQFRSSSSTGPAIFGSLYSIAIGPGGDVYVTDSNSVIRLDPSGNFVGWFGGAGTGPGRFTSVAGGVALAPGGDVYVVDQGACRVQRFDREGNFLSAFGSAGSAPGQFNFTPASGYAVGIEVDSAGGVYVVDPGNDRVQKLDPLGAPILAFPVAIMSNQAFTQTGITVDAVGKIYVSRRGLPPCLQTFDAAGTMLSTIAGSGGAPDGQLAEVAGVTVDGAGNLYTAEAFSGRVQKFDAAGTFVIRLGTARSQTDGQFSGPTGVAWTATGDLLVGDGTPRIQRFSSSGQFLGKLTVAGIGSPMAMDSQGNVYLSGVASGLRKYSAAGTLLATIGIGQNITGIAVDAAGQVYVADASNRVQKFNASGALLIAFGSTGTGDGQFQVPRGLAVAPNGDLLVADSNNHRIQRFDGNGTYLSKIVPGGNADFSSPFSVAVDAQGLIFVGSYGNHRVHVFSATGSFVTRFGVPGGGLGEVSAGSGLAVFQGMLAVAESQSQRVQIFDVTNLDTQVPIVSITTPANGTVLGSTTVAIGGTVSDLSATTVTSSPLGVFLQLPAGGGPVGGTMSFPGADGLRNFSLSALDATGRTGGTSIQFTVDTTVPAAVVTSPLENAVLSTSLVTVTVLVSDLTATTLTFSHNGASCTLPTGSGTASTVVTLANGANAITVLVKDAAGNQRTVTRNVIADLAAPIVTITAPLDGSTFGVGASPVAVVADVADLSATTVSSTPAGVGASLPPGGGLVPGAVALVEGSNTITVRARDAYSREGSAAITVVLDTTAPALTIDAPAPGTPVRGAIDVAVTANDPLPGSGVKSVAFAIDAVPVATDTEAPFGLVLDTATLTDGSHTLTAVATDGKGNLRSAPLTLVVDNTPPTLTLTAPAANAVVSGPALGITAAAADSGTGLRSVTFKVGNVAPSVDGSATYASPLASATPSAQEDTTRWPDGARLVTVTAVDDAGNEAIATVSVIVDNTAPDSALVSPADGAQVSGIVSIVARTTEANLQSLVIKVDGNVVGSTAAATLTVPFDTSGRSAGPMLIEVIVTDLANHKSTSKATVQVVNFTFDLEPEKLELKSRERGTVTAHIEGAAVAALLPIRSHVIELRVRGGNPVPVKSAGEHRDEAENWRTRCGRTRLPDLALRFDRQDFIASIRAGIALGYLPATGVVKVELVVDGVVFATSSVLVKSCEHPGCRSCGGHGR